MYLLLLYINKQYTMFDTLPDNSTSVACQYLLDPLSTIIKLAILKNKPIGTKICIQHNTVILQEPGVFQGICRYFMNTNKTDIQFMYNPIYLACTHYLTSKFVSNMPRIRSLFICAVEGLQRLSETYKSCSIIQLCINYYTAIINNALLDTSLTGTVTPSPAIFQKDVMTSWFSSELVDAMNKQWTPEKIKIILNLIDFLVKDDLASSNVKSIETIMSNVDAETKNIVSKA